MRLFSRAAEQAMGYRVGAFALVAVGLPPSSFAAEFNYEVEKRVIDRVSHYMSLSVDTNIFLSNYRYGGGFRNSLRADDRDDYLRVNQALAQPLVYYGLEDGLCLGYYKGGDISYGYYREPGNGGYRMEDPEMAKHRRSCVDKDSGEMTECVLAPGAPYVSCGEGNGDCDELELCADEDSQRNCSALQAEDEVRECEERRKYCRKYTIKYAPSEVRETGMGYVPITNFCHDMRGLFTQEPDVVVQGHVPSSHDLAAIVNPANGNIFVHNLGSCYYGDSKTLVNRSLVGDYAYCGGSGEVCNGTFVGGYESNDYDPRYRPWYIVTKELQRPTWTDPYPFFDLGLGISCTHPIYDIVGGRNVFAGVLAVDYRFEDIAEFLLSSFGESTTAVAIYEDEEPNYIIGLSTGTPSAILVHSEDPTQPCPVNSGSGTSCNPVRIPMLDLLGVHGDHPMAHVLALSVAKHLEAGYPKELVTVRESEEVGSAVYLSQSSLYEQRGANLKWRIVVTSPGEMSSSDSIEAGNPLFGAVISIGAAGVFFCSGLFAIFYRKRTEKAIIFADWRFTSAFILGCAVFNGSTFSLLGPNTDATCMLRMWMFHMLFVVALAPLFVKIWRMKKLVGCSGSFQRRKISNARAATLCLPMVATQAIICTLISLLDPPHKAEVNEVSEGVITQHIICRSNTRALLITEAIFETSLVFAGCILAYQTRNVDKRFGESKQLIFAMYNIALVAMTFLITLLVAEMEPNGRSLLRAIGVFWGTVFSSAAFVIPRLLQVRSGFGQGSVQVSIANQHRPKLGPSKFPESNLPQLGPESPKSSIETDDVPQ